MHIDLNCDELGSVYQTAQTKRWNILGKILFLRELTSYSLHSSAAPSYPPALCQSNRFAILEACFLPLRLQSRFHSGIVNCQCNLSTQENYPQDQNATQEDTNKPPSLSLKLSLTQTYIPLYLPFFFFQCQQYKRGFKAVDFNAEKVLCFGKRERMLLHEQDITTSVGCFTSARMREKVPAHCTKKFISMCKLTGMDGRMI